MSNSLVNLQGSLDSWFETDRLVEFHNGDLKLLFKAKRGSTLDFRTLLDICSKADAVNSLYMILEMIQVLKD